MVTQYNLEDSFQQVLKQQRRYNWSQLGDLASLF